MALTTEYGVGVGVGWRDSEGSLKVGRCHLSPSMLPLGQSEKMMGLQFKDHHITTEE